MRTCSGKTDPLGATLEGAATRSNPVGLLLQGREVRLWE